MREGEGMEGRDVSHTYMYASIRHLIRRYEPVNKGRRRYDKLHLHVYAMCTWRVGV